MLCGYLEDEGFFSTAAEDGRAMWRCLREVEVDLILLDVVMPGEDGLALARELRKKRSLPIIMLTGKGEMVDRVVGLEVGADDYIVKPFYLREVLARIRTVLRRCAPAAVQAEATPPLGHHEETDCVAFDKWTFDLVKRELRAKDGSLLPLTTGEFDLLSAFVRNPNRVLSRDQLMDSVRGRDWTPYDRSIDTLVGRLRKKIEADPSQPKLIKTVRGIGYTFVERLKSV
ncbi:response regulator [Pelagibius litoralis]|uniref:Regulatory protein VirG n=2 Tax=Pelagibius litoralis TaxID=374515 RepID=A0A967KA55_9PROT|nr:response regulator [Pelagibius litoralis]